MPSVAVSMCILLIPKSSTSNSQQSISDLLGDAVEEQLVENDENWCG